MTQERTPCEVWTRVMGYHRPVTSFNQGKKSEHYSRTHFKETTCANSNFCNQYAAQETTSSHILITTTACPKCPAMKEVVSKNNIDAIIIDENHEDFQMIANKYGIQSVPTLLKLDCEGNLIKSFTDASELEVTTTI